MDYQGATLRLLEAKDAKRLAMLANDARIEAQVRDGFPHPYGVKDARAFIKQNEAMSPVRVFGIEAAEGLVGVVGVEPQDNVFSVSMELGYWVGVPYWGKQYATAAVMRMVEYAWRAFPEVTRLWAYVFESNPASRRVLEKCGFVLEGTLRQAIIKRGQVQGVWQMATYRAADDLMALATK